MWQRRPAAAAAAAAAAQRAVLVVTHDLRELLPLADVAWTMAPGGRLASVPLAELRAAEEQAAAGGDGGLLL